jgi:hypothetical protein
LAWRRSVGPASLIEYEIVDAADALIASARTVIVRFDYAAGRPVPISDEMKEALTRDLIGSRGSRFAGSRFGAWLPRFRPEGCGCRDT